MSRQNKSPIYFTFKGLAWKLLIDPVSSVLVTEWRDEESREVNFSAMDLTNLKELWKGISNKEKWWLGLEEARNNLLILHGYKDLQNPEHKGIHTYDLRSGKFLWESADDAFVSMQKDCVIVYQPSASEKVFRKVNANTGKEIEVVREDELLYSMEETAETVSEILNSHHYTVENKYFEKISGFIQEFAGKQPEGAVDYLEYKGKIIVSFYSKELEKLVNYLMVVSEEGEITYKEEIGTGLKGIGLETFFLYKDLLIFVKNKKELVILEF